jgi:hypothetical protein
MPGFDDGAAGAFGGLSGGGGVMVGDGVSFTSLVSLQRGCETNSLIR